MVSASDKSLKEIRRDFHAYPEAGWKEFRTTAIVAEELDRLGFDLSLGVDAVESSQRLGVPSEDELSSAKQRALEEDAPEEYVERMADITGLVAEKTYNGGNGPVVGVRIDMDALERTEASDEKHRPAREGFASSHPHEMHACGHDGHTTIGLGIARTLEDEFNGTLKLFFQPAEEGGRGGLPMSETEHLTDVNYFIALHLGLGHETGTVIAGCERPLSNAKIDATFSGEPAHAGQEPNAGKNALQAATTGIQNLYAIPRHSDGTTRINVGQVESPNAQNVISEETKMRVEVRGETADLNEYMLEKTRRILEHAAAMHEVELETQLYGKTTTFTADQEAIDAIMKGANEVGTVTDIIERDNLGGSEDASYLIQRVQESNGKATYIGVGASNPYGHHTARFDIDEEALQIGVDVVTETIRSL